MKPWSKTSWQTHPAMQLPDYPNLSDVKKVTDHLEGLPPLVTPLEIHALKTQLSQAQRGECFLLQGGDCAEQFSECQESLITNKFKILLQMSLILLHGLQKPIIHVGRIAGQYAKPRSNTTESCFGKTLPSYRGDIINGAEFTEQARMPNPHRMLEGYHYAALTMNYLRALVDGGFADLRHPEYWHLDYALNPKIKRQFDASSKDIQKTLDKLHLLPGAQAYNPKQINFYTSHEALLLPYEQALTRYVEQEAKWYNLSTHFPWIGKRTSMLNGAHIEYMRGIANPLSIKISTETNPNELIKVLSKLNPENEPGKINLIHRFGIANIQQHLPPLIKTIQHSGFVVLWSCDPMHGNTHHTASGIKTRHFDDILAELRLAFSIHQDSAVPLGGVHFEMTGENVTECIGGSTGITEKQLTNTYKSLVDPRLNYEQALEIALMIAEKDY